MCSLQQVLADRHKNSSLGLVLLVVVRNSDPVAIELQELNFSLLSCRRSKSRRCQPFIVLPHACGMRADSLFSDVVSRSAGGVHTA